jgi:hypothetical protein
MCNVLHVCRVGQNRINAEPYVTIYLVIPLPKVQYVHRTYSGAGQPTHMPTTTTATECPDGGFQV